MHPSTTRCCSHQNMQIPASYRAHTKWSWQRQFTRQVILEHGPGTCLMCSTPEAAINGQCSSTGKVDAIWRGRFKDVSPASAPSQNFPPTGQGCPLFCCLAGCSLSPHSGTPEVNRVWAENEWLPGTEQRATEPSPCRSPFCTQENGDPGSYMHRIGYELMILQPYDQEKALIGSWP
jgi:hypothetical protein